MSEIWLNVLTSGLVMGVVYALIAIGLTLIFGVLRVVNFAHGEMVVIGMYVGYWSTTLGHLPLPVAIGLAGILLFTLGYCLQRFIVNRVMDRPPSVQFLLFIALALLITGMHALLFGPDPRGITTMESFEVYRVGSLRIDASKAKAAAVAVLLIAALWVLLKYTLLGKAIRAAASNPLGARVIAMRVDHILAITTGIGAACAGAAGVLIAPLFNTTPFLAPELTLLAFIIVIIGGLGSLPGALVGGLLIGLTESMAALLVGASIKSLFSYGLLMLVILFRPSGLFGEKGLT